MQRNKAYDYVEKMILARIKQGLAPWQKTWNADPINFYRKTAYHGINLFILAMAAEEQKVRSVWTTFHQAQEAGNPLTHASKGKGVTIVHSNWIFDEDLQANKWRGLKFYTVFSVDYQVTPPPVAETDALKPIPKDAQEVIDNMQARPDIKTSDTSAYYSPNKDFINVPEVVYFNTGADWVSVMFHELSHSTGHSSRLARFASDYVMPAREDYAQEELIAEFSASFLCAACDITQTLDNSAAYIQGWSKAIKKDPDFLTKAISKGQAAANYILGPEPTEDLTEKE